MWKYLVLSFSLLLGLVGGYGLVFGGSFVFHTEIRYIATLADTIYLGDENSDSSYVFFRSNIDISEGKIVSNCDVRSDFVGVKEDVYVFEIDYSSAQECYNGGFVLQLGANKVANASGKIKIQQEISFLDTLLDLDSEILRNMLENEEEKLAKNVIYKNYTGKNLLQNLSYAKGQSEYYIAAYKQQLLSEILSGREKKYSSPVKGYSLQYDRNKVPNTGRPYRAGYTDGVHRGWDIDAPIGTPVIALDDGIIVRIVDDFSNSDFARIVYGENLSEMQELKNLDILRGRQVWLKTMKGEVVFYSHLEQVDTEIRLGERVKRGDKLGTIGVSGVPGEGYDDYHLHFAVMKNPYISEKAGNYDFGDYMSWDWLTKGMNHEDTVAATKEIFE